MQKWRNWDGISRGGEISVSPFKGKLGKLRDRVGPKPPFFGINLTETRYAQPSTEQGAREDRAATVFASTNSLSKETQSVPGEPFRKAAATKTYLAMQI